MKGNLTREVSYIGRGVYETNDKRIRLAISGIWLNTDYNPAAGDTAFGKTVGAGSLQFSPIYFSAQYNAERWTLTSEYALRHFVYRDFGNKKSIALISLVKAFISKASIVSHQNGKALYVMMCCLQIDQIVMEASLLLRTLMLLPIAVMQKTLR
jgi:hypothetical protein